MRGLSSCAVTCLSQKKKATLFLFYITLYIALWARQNVRPFDWTDGKIGRMNDKNRRRKKKGKVFTKIYKLFCFVRFHFSLLVAQAKVYVFYILPECFSLFFKKWKLSPQYLCEKLLFSSTRTIIKEEK